MSRDAYIEMCEQLGTEPKPEEMPVSLEDLPLEVELAYHVYNLLPDKIDSFNGIYYGKALEHCPIMFDFLDIESRKDIFKIVIIIDTLERDEKNRKRKRNHGR